ncbi:MAG: hypothetical protein LUI07_07355, partial [Lachnospiraceae bacterium]|nr:hypothetical protein [Lachnospiraceae bacterium]
DTDASALPASVSREEDDEQALCAHGNAEADCAVCAVEAQIAALPSAAEAESLGDDGQSQVYAQASAAYDAYCALTQEEQAQVSNSDALFALLDFFSGGTATTAEEEDLCENCGSGYYDNGICTGCGAYQSAELNENGCYEIGNAGQLFWFAALVNGGSTSASAVLTADIDLNPGFSFSAQDGTYTGSGTPRSWTPIGGGSSSSNAYAGSFDGNGHTVSGIYINASTMYQGLFGGLYGGTVQNVTVSNSSITGTQYVGGIAGKLVANNVITGCVNNGYVKGSSSSSTYTGGIAGYIYNSTVSGCTNHGNVAGAGYYVCGVVGLAASGASTCVTDCHNTGDVSGSSQYVGGVIGYIKSSCTTDIANCSNSGNITGGSYYAGGVIGYASITATVVNCSNEGDVSAGGYDVGGIVGYLPSSNGISTCCNSGNISGTTYVGGIVGNASVSTGYSIADCLNIGSVSATASSGTPYAGGIIGAFNKGTLMNCCSVGNVSGSSVGGIAGYVASSGTIDNSYYLDTAADSAVASNNASGTVSAEAKNAEAFASGEVTWLLNGGEDGATDGTQIWYQTLGQSDIPAFSGATVYYEEGRGWFNADQPTVYSVEIAWGDLAFTYQSATDVWNPETHQYESAASSVWSWADGGNIITVTNGSNASVSVSVSYQPAEGYSGILGSFDKTSSLLTPLGTDSFALSLSAADDSILQALQESTCIGAVVVTIGTDNTDSH